ncbi:hypothetical protein [Nocardioides sp.]|uniref:hypothetical protein n=1 Tax=Nocardioides sp. TaxID=35761 RepID=UPI0026064C97|nr:hypothetical protein [Nocardioides sp.]
MRTTTMRRVGRTAAGMIAASLGLTALAVSPAHAADAILSLGADSGATASTPDIAYVGQAIHLEGTAWTKSAGVAGCVAVKLGNGTGASIANALAVTQSPVPTSTGACSGLSAPDGVYAMVPTDASGAFSVDLPFPTTANTSPAITEGSWAAGTTHHVRLLTGFDGATPRSGYADFTVATPATTPTLSDVTVSYSASGPSAALSGSGFPGGSTLTATLDGTALTFSGRGLTTGPTYAVPATGAISGVNVVLPAGTRAGAHTVTIHGTDATSAGYDVPVTVNVTPSLTWSAGIKPGASGTLTVSGIATGAVISSVKDGSVEIASALGAADASGTATGAYSVPASTTAGFRPFVLTQTSPNATFTVNTVVYPNEVVSGAARFAITSDANDPALFQGLYQSAYSEKEKVLFATSANRSTKEGYLYKLDADTLQVIASAHASTTATDVPTDVDGVKAAAQFGVGVDDVNGTVWTTSTSDTSVSVYRASDLKLLKQFPTGTLDHPRDVVYDPKTDHIFVSSASEGTSGNGYLTVFEGGDNNKNGTPYEVVKKLKTGPRSAFNPVSLSLDNGTLVSPSLATDQVAVIDTAKAVTSAVPDAADAVDSSVRFIEIGDHSSAGNGRGASGAAYDDEDHRIFIASQNDNAVFVADSRTGELIATVPTGQQALNVTYDKVHKLAYVANLGGTTLTVLDKNGAKVAALPVAKANHVSVNDAGTVFAVDKVSPTNHVWKIEPRIEALGGVDLLDPTKAGITGDEKTTPLEVTATYGQPIHLEGTNFRTSDGTSGSTLGVKPASVSGSPTIATIEAGTDGSFAVDVPFPDGWTVGDTQHLRVLSGSLKTGDTARSFAIKVTVKAAGAVAVSTPRISGSATVGQTLSATASSTTAGAKLAYQWKRDNTAIAGATAATYKVTSADAGHQLSVAVTATATGYTTTTTSSTSVKVAAVTKPLTPAEKKVQAAQAKVTAAAAKVKSITSQISAVKKSSLSKKAKATKVKALNKKLSAAKKTLAKNKTALTKAQKALKKSTKK